MRFITFGSQAKPCQVKYLKWLLKVIEGQRAGKGHVLLLDRTTKGILEARVLSRENTGRPQHMIFFFFPLFKWQPHSW